MDKIKNLFQTYRQAIWRTQRQWIGLALILVVISVMIAATYLSITARTALTGRSIQDLREEISANELVNADLETQYANFTSANVVEQRARALGFRPAEPNELIYINVPGYTPKPDFKPAATGQDPASNQPNPEYAESLLDWFSRYLVSSPFDGAQR